MTRDFECKKFVGECPASDPYHKLSLGFCVTSKNVFLIYIFLIYIFPQYTRKAFFENIEHILHVICHKVI